MGEGSCRPIPESLLSPLSSPAPPWLISRASRSSAPRRVRVLPRRCPSPAPVSTVSKSSRRLEAGHLPCRNIPAFPCTTACFENTQLGTDFEKVAPLGASRERFCPAFSLRLPFWEHRPSDRLGEPTPALCLVRCQRAAILPSSLRRW